MLTPYLILAGFGLAAANPLLQRIPLQIPGQYPASACPTQTCPAQTCPTQKCPTQACPTSRPPCQACQNPYRSAYNPQPIVIQSSNNCPCNKQVTAQNPVANPVSQDTLSQMVMRRLLSSAQPQMQVNPPANTCNHCEPQKTVPNIINNYIIIPPEYFKANETTVDKHESVQHRRKGKRRKQRQRSQKSPVCPCEDNDEQNNGTVTVKEQATSCPCHKENSKPISAEVQNSKINNASRSKTKAVNEKRPESINSKSTNKLQNDKIITKYEESSKIPHKGNSNMDTKNPKKENRERPRSLEEAIIRDFCKKHPTIPEEIARSLLKKLINQIDKKDNPNKSPYPFAPFGFDHYDPELFYPRYDEYARAYNDRLENDRRSRKRKPHRSGRRNKKPIEEIKKVSEICDTECENLKINPTVINIETETITTEKIRTTTEKLKENVPIKDSETQMESPDDLYDQLDQLKAKFAKLNEIETTTVSYNKRIEQYPELGKEDKVPTVYDNGVDDYYPNFRGENIGLYGSDEECDSKEDNKQYNADKTKTSDSKRYVNINKPKTNDKNNSHTHETSTEQSYPVSTESYESYEESNDNEEVRFIIPPHLELPDFETKQVNIVPQINDKSVTDEEPEIEMKPAKVFTKDKSGRTNIETVYGRSRVVKYGHDAQTAASEPVITYYLPEEAMTEDRIQLPDGEGIVVVAKSIRDLEDDWDLI